MEWLAALALLAASAPLLVALAMVVVASSKGPVIYRQRRLGKNGRQFYIYKFRTMYSYAEKLTGPVWCQPGDSRVTPVGQFLRRLHLDELPQLVNVLRGEMSLIGPRPERPEFVETLSIRIPNYAERLRVRPGITGLAQIRLPADVDEQSVAEKVRFDLQYIENVSPRLDLAILWTTALQMFGLRQVAWQATAASPA